MTYTALMSDFHWSSVQFSPDGIFVWAHDSDGKAIRLALPDPEMRELVSTLIGSINARECDAGHGPLWKKLREDVSMRKD